MGWYLRSVQKNLCENQKLPKYWGRIIFVDHFISTKTNLREKYIDVDWQKIGRTH